MTLNGTVSQPTNASGVATFSDLKITTAGSYVLKATGASLTATSNSFKITAGPAINITPLSGGGQTAAAGAAYASPLKASVDDAYGNPIAGVPVTFTAPAAGASVMFAGASTVTTDASGVATSPVLTANSEVGDLQIEAMTAGAPSPAAFSLRNVAGAVNKLAFVQPPTDAAAGQIIAPPVTVQLLDTFGNAAHTAGVGVAVQVDPVVGRLRGLRALAPQNTDTNGLATFANLSVDQAGQYTLLATSASIASATSGPFSIRAGAAANIQATTGTPQSVAVQTPFAQQLQATVRDSVGNPVDGVMVTFSAPGSGASAALNPPAVTTDSNGHANTTVTADSIAGSYIVTASVPNVSGNAQFALTNVAGGVGQVSFVQQPSNILAGSPITPAVVVLLIDGDGDVMGGAGVTMSLRGSATLGGTTTATTDAGGHATFADLTVTAAGSYQLAAVSGNISAASNTFQVSSSRSSVAISVFDGDGQGAGLGSSYGAPLQAKVADPFGNAIAGVSVTFTAPSSGASVSFAGPATVTTDPSGVAISPAMTAISEPGAFQVSAATPGAASPALFNLSNLPGSGANHLAFIQQPTDTLDIATITPPVTVQLQDGSGNPVQTAGVAVTLQPNALARRLRLVSGTATQNTDATGLATFANLSGSQAGTYQLTALASGVASATSNLFHITASQPAVIEPAPGTPADIIVPAGSSTSVQARILDAARNPVRGVRVVFTAPTSGPSGTFGGQSSIAVDTDENGYASAAITSNGILGDYAITASSTAITGSIVYELTNAPVGTSTLAFVQQPCNTAAGQPIAPPVTVQVRDAAGNAAGIAGVPVTLSLSSGNGLISGTLVQLTNPNGLATFNDLRVDQTGSKRLRAISPQQAPTESNAFQITPGAPASIAAFSGAPQSTTAAQQFPLRLQARVTDAAGNGISGAGVTFTAPSSGPSGSFAGAATVTTGFNGLATAPVLTADGIAGDFMATASESGLSSPAAFSLTNLPQQSSALLVDPADLSFVNEISQAEPAGQTVQIISAAGATLAWTAISSAPWLAVTPASGTTPGQITVSVNPAGLAAGRYTGSIRIADANGGVASVPVTYVITNKPVLTISPATMTFVTAGNTMTPAAQTLTTTSSSRAIAYGVAVQMSTPPGGGWLQVSAAQGRTPGALTVNVNPAGLPSGIYDGSVLFTPTESAIQPVVVPVTLILGCGQGGCLVQPRILAVVNGASFQPGGAPGAAMTVFGTDLSDTTYQAPAYPLPAQLGPTTVMINGIIAPLYYVSPTQINFQMPSGIPAGDITVVVSNGAVASTRALRASPSHTSSVDVVDPGLFVTPDKRAAALNVDLTPHTAATPIPPGGYVILYLTGQGPVTPSLSDGAAAPASPLSIVNAPVQVTIGGARAQVTFQGLAPGFAGLAQLNVIVPAGLAPGDQPVFVSINGAPSNAGVITVR